MSGHWHDVCSFTSVHRLYKLWNYSLQTSDFTVAASVFHIQSMLKKQSHPVTVVKQPTENVGFLDNSIKQSTNTTFIDKKSYISKQ